MTRLALLAALALLALPATAPAKGRDGGTLLHWLSKPDGKRAGATWAARFAIVDPGGNRLLLGNAVHPEVRISGPSEQSFPAIDDGSGGYSAQVTFPAAGDYVVEAVGFDARDPERFIDTGPPVHVGAAAAAPARASGSGGDPYWWVLILIPLALAFSRRRGLRSKKCSPGSPPARSRSTRSPSSP